MTITQLTINLAEAELCLREAWKADMRRLYLVEHHLCSHDYTVAWWNWCEVYWRLQSAVEKAGKAA